MLMYADDMVVWGETEVELKEKLTIAIDTTDKLGLSVQKKQKCNTTNGCTQQEKGKHWK